MHVLAREGGEGSNLKLLGVVFDHALSMKDAIHELVADASWKIASILRTTRFFTDGELVNLYKSKLLSFLEYRTAAIYHACDTTLAPLNRFQERFLSELGISPADALFHFHPIGVHARHGKAWRVASMCFGPRPCTLQGLLSARQFGSAPNPFRKSTTQPPARGHSEPCFS